LLRTCKQHPSLGEVPFLMVTSQSSIERMKIMQAAKENVDQYLLKPFTSDDIRKRVQTKLEKARSRSQVLALVAEGTDNLERGRFTPDLHFHLGRMYNKRDMIPEAKAEFEKTLEIQLDHQEARLMLAMLSQGKR